MGDTRMIVTKHFDPAYIDHINKGRFRVGTLASYCADEKSSITKQGVISDTGEGKAQESWLGNRHFDSLNIPGVGNFTNISFEGAHHSSISVTTEFDAYVFCLSHGAYSRERHLKIVNGDESANYKSTGEYTAYVQLDLNKFGKALANALAVKLGIDEGIRLCGKKVRYECREIWVEIQELTSGSSTTDAIERATFIKPEIFSPEEEIRLIFLLKNNEIIQPKTKFVDLQSQALKSSIIGTPEVVEQI